jgi:hypothetical protein
MYIKKLAFALSLLTLLAFVVTTTVQPKHLNEMLGSWKGTLQYLDYTSNKQVSIPANFKMTKIENRSNTFLVQFFYSDEPQANQSDTLFLNNNGKKIDDYAVTYNQLEKGTRTIVVTKKDVDGNDHKMAWIKKTYRISNRTLSIQKEVQFDGTKDWTVRHTYSFTRK